MGKKLIISCATVILLITVLFFYVLSAIQRDMKREQVRSERHLGASVESAINMIKDNIYYIYREFSNNSKHLENEEITEDMDLRPWFNLNETLFKGFPNIISSGVIIEIEEADKLISLLNNSMIPDRIFKNTVLLNREINREKIYLRDFSGFMLFPLSYNNKNQITRFILFEIYLEDLIESYLPLLIGLTLEKKYSFDSPIEMKIDTGKNLMKAPDFWSADIIVDLNKSFNISRIHEFYDDRLDKVSTFISDKSYRLNPEHKYLFISRYNDSLKNFYQGRYKSYVMGLVFVYLILVTAIAVFFYTSWRIYKNNIREKDFTSLISHELKTPLSVIQLGADNLSAGVIEEREDVVYYGDMIKKETHQLKNMIDKILTISTSTSSGEYKTFHNVKTELIISRLKEQSQSLLRQLNVTLELKNSSSVKNLYCNETTFIAAVFNVIQNSIRYGAAFSQDRTLYIDVKESVKKRKKGLNIQIRDYGPGISRRDSRHIFKPFYRGEKMKELQLSGTGLGLSFARRVLHEHRGTLELIHTHKKETLFEVWIPVGGENEENSVN